jgi:hypothetical protein
MLSLAKNQAAGVEKRENSTSNYLAGSEFDLRIKFSRAGVILESKRAEGALARRTDTSSL